MMRAMKTLAHARARIAAAEREARYLAILRIECAVVAAILFLEILH